MPLEQMYYLISNCIQKGHLLWQEKVSDQLLVSVQKCFPVAPRHVGVLFNRLMNTVALEQFCMEE